jgi:signal transduction histidine kinase
VTAVIGGRDVVTDLRAANGFLDPRGGTGTLAPDDDRPEPEVPLPGATGLLERVALALHAALDLKTVFRLLGEVALDVSGAEHCSLLLIEGPRLRRAYAVGGEPNAERWAQFRALPPLDMDESYLRLFAESRAVPVEDARGSELVPAEWAETFSLGALILVPLRFQGEPLGLLAVDWSTPRRFDPRVVRLLETIGAYAGLAVRNARLFQRLHTLYRAITRFNDETDAPGLVDRLNEVLADHGIEVVDLAFRDRGLAKQLGGAKPSAEERATWRTGEAVPLPDQSLAVPLHLGRRVIGTLRVRPAELDQEQRSLLDTLGRELAESASRGALRVDVEEARRERALAAERERIAADVHDTAGQLFVALGLLARRHMEQLPKGSDLAQQALRIAELAEQGKWQTVEAVRSIAFVPAGRRGLVPALRALVRSFAADSGIETSLEVSGRPVRQPVPVERALHRVAHEALTNAWRHAHCRHIRVEVAFGSEDVTLSVTDDGVGLAGRPAAIGGHFGVGGMRRLTAEVGGKLRVRNARPRGVLVEARVPKEPAGSR